MSAISMREAGVSLADAARNLSIMLRNMYRTNIEERYHNPVEKINRQEAFANVTGSSELYYLIFLYECALKTATLHSILRIFKLVGRQWIWRFYKWVHNSNYVTFAGHSCGVVAPYI